MPLNGGIEHKGVTLTTVQLFLAKVELAEIMKLSKQREIILIPEDSQPRFSMITRVNQKNRRLL